MIPDSSGSIRYYYCADGQLVRQEERRSGAGVRVRDYCGSVEFLNGGIDQIRHENGYIYLDRDLTEEHLYLTGSETVNKTYESISTVSERTIPSPRVIDYISEEGIILIPGFDLSVLERSSRFRHFKMERLSGSLKDEKAYILNTIYTQVVDHYEDIHPVDL